MKVNPEEIEAGGELHMSVEVTNTGARKGKEVVQHRQVLHPEVPPEPVEGPVEGWRGCRLVVVTGVVERGRGVVNVIARRVTGISPG